MPKNARPQWALSGKGIYMTVIRIFDGNSYTTVEVEDSFAAAYAEMEHRDNLTERKETRRHQSLNASMDNGFDFPDKTVNIEEDVISESRFAEIIKCLSDDQKEIVKLVYVEGYTLSEVAELKGINKSNATRRMQTILSTLKNNIKNF